MPDHQQLIQDCLRGKRAAQRELYEQFAGHMMGVCFLYTKSRRDAEDVLQEGFVRVFKSLHQYKREGELGAWIRRIMVTSAITYLRRYYRKREGIFITDDYIDPISIDNPDVLLDAKDLARLVCQLPPGYQTVFNLHVVEGYSHVEIGTLLEINEGTSRSQYSRARALLISWLERESEASLKTKYAR